MNLSILLDTTHTEEVSLLIDIGNGSIGAAFVVFKKGTRPEILESIRRPFSLYEKSEESQMLTATSDTLSETLKDLFNRGFSHVYWKNHKKHLEHALISFSSPWFVSKTKRVHTEEESEFMVTHEFLTHVTDMESAAFAHELAEANSGLIGTDVQIIEKAVVHSTINGYVVNEIIGKKTKTFDAYLSMSAMSKTALEAISEVVFKETHIPRDHMIFHSFPVVAFSVIRDLFPTEDDFIMMDITGESTDITLVNDSLVCSTVSFPSGRNFLIRQIAKAFDITPEIAESTLHLCITRKADDETTKKMDMLMSSVENEWSIYFENALQELAQCGILPRNVYLTVDPDVADLYVQFLTIQKTDTTADFRKKMSVVHMKPDTFLSLITSNPLLNPDEFICFLSIFGKKVWRT